MTDYFFWWGVRLIFGWWVLVPWAGCRGIGHSFVQDTRDDVALSSSVFVIAPE
jgi:hypothetical protein